MIVYFSATGNCKYVAKQLADVFDEEIHSILDINSIDLNDSEMLGFIFPTYFWALPSNVNEFLENVSIQLSKNNYIYFISTYGTTTGDSAGYVENHLKRKGIQLNASYAVRTVDTWTVRFDLTDQDLVNKFNSREKPQITNIINHIQNKDNGNFIKDKTSGILARVAQWYYNLSRKTSNLNVNNTCIGCSLCSKNCPVNAIEMIDKKPVWSKNKCAICFSCIHHCPKFAINYKNKTQNHSQYTHP